ncbi:uncharacterized protein METZ01_LOCUS12912 [marine metagenome]|uniref:Uncharacterized protein n=1 Tax=marine metagenome TaxID=408172 RepID=A0A381P1J6_9ZZZZ
MGVSVQADTQLTLQLTLDDAPSIIWAEPTI